MTKLSLPVIVTPSRIELAQRCYRRHVLSDLLQRAGYYSPSLEFGSVIHAGAGAWWNNANLENGLVARAKAVSAVRTEWNKRFEQNPQVSQKDVSLDLAIAIIESYTQLADLRGPFGLEPGDWQIVSVEDRLEVPLVIPNGLARLSFQTDRVVFNKTNDHLVVIDTKTSSRMDKRWERQWETSLQMKLYKAGASRAYDIPPENISVVIEGILKEAKPALKYIECPDWSVGLLNEAILQAQSVASRDYRLIAVEDLPRDQHLIIEDALSKTDVNYMSCFEYGVECAFRKLCVANIEERVPMLMAEYFELPEEDSGY